MTRTLTAARDGDGVTITADGAAARWRTAAAGGQADPRLLDDRPAEERTRPSWSVRWAVPVTAVKGEAEAGGEGRGRGPEGWRRAGRLPAHLAFPLHGVGGVVHAPTPTDEPLGLPALLLASFPLSPDRRHVAPGPLTDFLVDQAAAGLRPPAARPRARTRPARPGPGSGRRGASWTRGWAARSRPGCGKPRSCPPPTGPACRIRPRDAVILDAALPRLADCLAPVLPSLIAGPARHPAYAILGVRRLGLADMADTLAALDRDPSWWQALYDALAAAEPR